MLTRYQDWAAGTHGFGTPDRTCLEGIRKGLLQDLTGKEQQIVHAYEVLGRDAGFHGFGTPDRTCLRGIRTGLQDLTGLEKGSNMHTRYQDGAAGHVRSGLQDLTGWELEIVHTYEVLGRGCRVLRVRQTRSGWGFRISRIRNNSSNLHTRNYNGAAGSHG